MGSANIGCTEHTPFRIEPEFGQRPEYSIQPPASDRWDVFQKDPLGSYFANDSEQLVEQAAALAVEARTFACDADVLAGETACDKVDAASPCVSVKRGNIIVNLHLGRQPSFVASCLQNGAAVRVDLDGTDGTVAEQQRAEQAAA